MKVADAFRTVSSLFLDTSPAIFFLERHPTYGPLVDYPFDLIDRGSISAVTSAVTLAECLIMPIRNNDQTARTAFTRLILHGKGVTFQPVSELASLSAAELGANHNLALTDAFQAAITILSGCDAILTNDAVFKRVPGLNVILVDDLEL